MFKSIARMTSKPLSVQDYYKRKSCWNYQVILNKCETCSLTTSYFSRKKNSNVHNSPNSYQNQLKLILWKYLISIYCVNYNVWVVSCNIISEIRFYTQSVTDRNLMHITVWYFAWIMWICCLIISASYKQIE